MREILFRGKTKDGKWVVGNGIIQGVDHISYARWVDISNDKIRYEVIPETVGQFTGLTDKNGKKIFEGDIVRFSHEAYDEDFIGAVIFDECESGFILKNGDGWVGFSYIGECYEVIGNIHDNPELLEKVE